MKLYSYFRSSAAYRVRIALNLKGVDYQQIPVNLLKGEQHQSSYRQINPEGLVPAVVAENGILTQSLAIIEWLDEQFPQPALLPENSWARARVRSMAYAIACDVHPLNNTRVITHLKERLAVDDPFGADWYQHWIHTGFDALEKQVEASPFCQGDKPTLADICLVPQVFNAMRFKVDMALYPKILRIWEHCKTIDAFIQAEPENQPDNN